VRRGAGAVGAAVVCALLLATAGLILLWPGSSGAPPVAGADLDRSAGGGGGGASGDVSEPGEVVRREDEVAAAGRTVTLRGRCVDRQGGEALAGAVIAVRLGPADGSEGENAGGRAVAAADGAFAIAFPSPTGATVATVQVVADGFVGVRGRIALGDRATLDLGSVPLRRGVRLSGRVADDVGRGAANARVVLVRRGEEVDGGDWREVWVGSAHTGPDGAFRLTDALPAGTWHVRLEGAPRLRSSTTVELAGLDRHLSLRCGSLDPTQRLWGRVVDVDGRPVAGALVLASGDHGSGPHPPQAQSGADGGFVLFADGGPGPAEPVLVTVAVPGGGRAHGPFGPLPWGSAEHRLVIPATQGIALRVFDTATGRGVGDYRVRCVAVDGVRGDGTVTVAMGSDGWARLAGLGRGRHQIAVWPTDPTLLPGLPTEFEVGAADLVEVGLHRGTPCAVVVVDEAGEPVAGASVELLAPFPDRRGAGALRPDVPVRDVAALLDRGGLRNTVAARLATGITSTTGMATLLARGDGDAGPLWLAVSGAGIAPLRRSGVRLDSTAPLRVVVQRSGEVAGTVRLRGQTDPVRIVLRGEDGRTHPPPWMPPVVVATPENGTFHMPSVPAGEWRVDVRAPVVEGGRTLSGRATVGPGTAVRVVAGQVSPVGLVADAAPAGTVLGTAFVDGQPAADGVALLVGEVTAGDVRAVARIAAGVDGAGAFRFAGLQPRRYALAVVVGGRDVRVGDWFELRPGQERRAALQLRTGRAHIVATTSDGGPAVQERLELRGAAGAWAFVTDVRGEVTTTRLPVGVYRIVSVRRDGITAVGEVELSGAAMPAVVTVTLP